MLFKVIDFALSLLELFGSSILFVAVAHLSASHLPQEQWSGGTFGREKKVTGVAFRETFQPEETFLNQPFEFIQEHALAWKIFSQSKNLYGEHFGGMLSGGLACTSIILECTSSAQYLFHDFF